VAERLGHGRRWSADGLIGSLATAPEGQRNDRLNWAAHRIGLDVFERRATRGQGDTACADLESTARLIGLDENEIVPTIMSGYAAGLSGRPALRVVS
jgi:hypothetical protein